MAKYGNFNYDPESTIEKILEDYKSYRKSNDRKGYIKESDYKDLKSKLEGYESKERESIKKTLAAKINPDKAEKLIKYTTFDGEIDWSDEASIMKKFEDTNKDLFGESKPIDDKAAKAKATVTKVTETKEKESGDSKEYRFMK